MVENESASASKSLTEDELVSIAYNEYLAFQSRQHTQAEIDSINQPDRPDRRQRTCFAENFNFAGGHLGHNDYTVRHATRLRATRLRVLILYSVHCAVGTVALAVRQADPQPFRCLRSRLPVVQ